MSYKDTCRDPSIRTGQAATGQDQFAPCRSSVVYIMIISVLHDGRDVFVATTGRADHPRAPSSIYQKIAHCAFRLRHRAYLCSRCNMVHKDSATRHEPWPRLARPNARCTGWLGPDMRTLLASHYTAEGRMSLGTKRKVDGHLKMEGRIAQICKGMSRLRRARMDLPASTPTGR
jgi:hypothetical protein